MKQRFKLGLTSIMLVLEYTAEKKRSREEDVGQEGRGQREGGILVVLRKDRNKHLNHKINNTEFIKPKL